MKKKLKYFGLMLATLSFTGLAVYAFFINKVEAQVFSAILGIMFYVKSVDYLELKPKEEQS